jgi:hypothetical protein
MPRCSRAELRKMEANLGIKLDDRQSKSLPVIESLSPGTAGEEDDKSFKLPGYRGKYGRVIAIKLMPDGTFWNTLERGCEPPRNNRGGIV